MSQLLIASRARLLGAVSVMALLAVAVFLPAPVNAGALPPGGTFIDDDGNTHEGMIEAIAAIEVTLGCNDDPPLYCPADDVTRGQMASFLDRAFDFPETAMDYFDDDNGTTHEAAINRIAEAGVTLGFPDGTYQPDGTVTREQMGSFVARAMGLVPIPGDVFDDVDGTHEANINAIADAGVTLGCSEDPPLYCPTDNVRRDQMASFIGRALDLDPIIPPPPTTTTTTTTTMATTTTTMGGSTQTITLSGITFTPMDVSVDLGTEVTFDNAAGDHDLVWESGPYPGWAPNSMGWEVTFTADTAGTFDYYCSVHGSPGVGMYGSLTVNP